MPMCGHCMRGIMRRRHQEEFRMETESPFADLEETFNISSDKKSCLLTMATPKESHLDEKIYMINLTLPSDLKVQPPKVQFLTHLPHPYIDSEGHVDKLYFDFIWVKVMDPSWAKRVLLALKQVFVRYEKPDIIGNEEIKLE